MTEILLKWLLRIIGKALPFLVRRHYRPERLAKLVHVRLDSASNGLELWASNIPYCQFWLVIRNASPFEMTLTGLCGRLQIGMGAAEFTRLKRLKIEPGDEQNFFVRSNLNLFELQYLHSQKPTSLGLEVCLQLASKITDFEVTVSLTTTHLQYVNFDSALTEWLPCLVEQAGRPRM
jgi:hypothetical protein